MVQSGNLARDPELRYTPTGTAVCDLRLAINIPNLDDALFMDVTVWEKLAETCAEALRKGSKVVVYGSLRPESWTDKEGNPRSKVTIRATQVEFMSPRPSDELDAAAEVTPRAPEPDRLPF